MNIDVKKCLCQVSGRQCKLNRKYPHNNPQFCAVHFKKCRQLYIDKPSVQRSLLGTKQEKEQKNVQEVRLILEQAKRAKQERERKNLQEVRLALGKPLLSTMKQVERTKQEREKKNVLEVSKPIASNREQKSMQQAIERMKKQATEKKDRQIQQVKQARQAIERKNLQQVKLDPKQTQVIAQHSRPSDSEDPATHTEQSLFIAFQPSLQQSRSSDDHTNYCAYYAVYNAQCLVDGRIQDLRNRDLFAKEFASQLRLIRQYRKENVYDNLYPNETRLLIDTQQMIAVVDLQSLYIYKEIGMDTLAEALDNDGKSAKLVEDFIACKINRLALVVLLTSTKQQSSGHWITILAERTKKQVKLTSMDSLHHIKWYLEDNQLIVNRIMPIYYVLTNQWQEMMKIIN